MRSLEGERGGITGQKKGNWLGNLLTDLFKDVPENYV
jgi:hypothetical protein